MEEVVAAILILTRYERLFAIIAYKRQFVDQHSSLARVLDTLARLLGLLATLTILAISLLPER